MSTRVTEYVWTATHFLPFNRGSVSWSLRLTVVNTAFGYRQSVHITEVQDTEFGFRINRWSAQGIDCLNKLASRYRIWSRRPDKPGRKS